MAPLLLTSDPTIRKRKLTIHLSDVDRIEEIPDRFLTLEYPSWSVEIGRGSATDENILPTPTNSWFTSKVVSRIHAELKADPITKVVTIRDCRSMHGTYLDGQRISGEPQQLVPEDVITFGARVQRGDDAFEPLKTAVGFDWSEDEGTPKRAQHRNKFTADFSDSESDIIEYSSDPEDRADIQTLHSQTFNKQLDTAMQRKPDLKHRQLRRSPSVEILSSPTRAGTKSSVSIDLTQDDTTVPETATSNLAPAKIADTIHPTDQQAVNENVTFPDFFPDHISEEYEEEEFDDDELDRALVDLSEEDWRTVSQIPVQTMSDPVSSSQPTRSSERDPSPSDAALAKPTPSWKDSPAVKKVVTEHTCEGTAPPPLPYPADTFTFTALPPLNLEHRLPSIASNLQPLFPGFAREPAESHTAEQHKPATPPSDSSGPVQLPTPDSAQLDRKRKRDDVEDEIEDGFDSEDDDLVPSEPGDATITGSSPLRGLAATSIISSVTETVKELAAPVNGKSDANEEAEAANTASQLERISLQETERPRKKARLGASIAKGAGLVLTGVAAGVVGTVVTLANLPPDFFA